MSDSQKLFAAAAAKIAVLHMDAEQHRESANSLRKGSIDQAMKLDAADAAASAAEDTAMLLDRCQRDSVRDDLEDLVDAVNGITRRTTPPRMAKSDYYRPTRSESWED